MNTFLRKTLFPLTLTLVFITSNGFANTSLTLDDLITMAIKNNPQIEIARQQYEQSRGIVTQSKSGYLPQISLSGDVGRSHVDNLNPVDEDNVIHGRISASQLIYDFGRTTGLIDASLFSSSAVQSQLEQQIQTVVFQVKQNYYQVLEKELLITVAQEALETYKQHLYRAEKYYEAGVRTKIDVTSAQVELSNAKLDLLRANANLKTARVKLEQILGTRPNKGDYTLDKKQGPLEQLAGEKPAMSAPLPQLLETANTHRPELQRSHSLIQASEASLNQARGDYFPSLQAVGSYDAFETDFSNLQDQWNIGIALNWDIFSGFQTEGKIAEAKAQVRELQASLKELKLAIEQDVTDSYLRADENREGVDLASQSVALARENLALAEGRYRAGLNDIVEFNDAQLTYTESQSNLVSTYYSYLTALARIEFATGTIPLPQELKMIRP